MEKKTGAEIIALLEANFNKSELIHGDICDNDVEKYIGGKAELAIQHGGEGYGDTIYAVYYFQEHDVYIRLNGYYSSQDGTDPQDYEEVSPREITSTVFDSVKNDDDDESSEEEFEEESSSEEEEDSSEEEEEDDETEENN